MNEELDTVNTELKRRVEELGIANSDLQNFFSGTDAAMLFVDTGLRLRRFTPAAGRIFHFIDGDLGRPLGDFALRLARVDLVSELNEVMRSLDRVQREVQSVDGNAWFLLRILPYRSVETVINGAVVTLTDITELKNVEADRRLATVVRDSNDAIMVLNLDGQIQAWNRGAAKLYGYSEDEALKLNIEDLVPEEARDPARGLLDAIKRGEEVAAFEVKRRTKDGRLVDVWLTATKLTDDQGRAVGVGTTERDVTESKRQG